MTGKGVRYILQRYVQKMEGPVVAERVIPADGEVSQFGLSGQPVVAEQIARIKGISPREVEEATWENGRAFFGI